MMIVVYSIVNREILTDITRWLCNKIDPVANEIHCFYGK